MIWRKLSDKYLVIDTSFEGVGDTVFESEYSFVRLIISLMKDALKNANGPQTSVLDESAPTTMKELSTVIRKFCKSVQKPVLLLIDKVDKSSDNQLFLNFVGMLRELYLMRDKQGMNYTFYSVVLAGVYDIKNLKAISEEIY